MRISKNRVNFVKNKTNTTITKTLLDLELNFYKLAFILYRVNYLRVVKMLRYIPVIRYR